MSLPVADGALEGAASAAEAAPSSAADSRWWIRDRERFDREMLALSEAGITVTPDEAAAAAGVLRLDLIHPPLAALGPDPVRLVAVFPDHYPFFPVHVEAPDLELEHHQNPLAKNLCLLAQPLGAWRPMTDTLAGLLAAQLERLVVAATSTPEMAAPLEEHVAEPATIYYPYESTSAVLLAPDGKGTPGRVPADVKRGTFVLGLEEFPHTGKALALRGTLLAVFDEAGNTMLQAASELTSRYAHRPRVTGRWARVDRAVFGESLEGAADAVYKASEEADPRGPKPEPLELGNGRRLRVRAILFPEEREWWGEANSEGDGWAFAVRVYQVSPGSPGGAVGGAAFAGRGGRGMRQNVPGGGLRASGAGRATGAGAAAGRSGPQPLPVVYLARPQRYARADLAVRAPELAPLAAHEMAVFGLGCLGAPSALEFARASLGGLRLLDGDHVDAATTLRWPFGLGAVGWPKARVIAGAIGNDYPYVRVDQERVFVHRLGDARRLAFQSDDEAPSETEILSKMLDGASLLYDACAERAVQYFLSQAARGRGLPYVGVQGTPGGWGGMVVCIDPARTEGCWGCLQHWLGAPTDIGGIPGAPADALHGDVPVEGCAERTYAGANPDLGEVALMGVRVAMGVLAGGGGREAGVVPSYPRAAWDVAVLSLRDDAGHLLAPRWQTYDLRRHPDCSLCAEAAATLVDASR